MPSAGNVKATISFFWHRNYKKKTLVPVFGI